MPYQLAVLHHSRQAFSLIELLVALSILAIVAALIVPRFLNVRSQAQTTVIAAQIDQLNRTYEQWLTMGGNVNGASGIQVVKFLTCAYNTTNNRREDSAGTADTDCIDSTGLMNSSLFSISAYASTAITAPTSASTDGFYRTANGGAAGGNLYYKTGNSLYPITFNSANSPVFVQPTGGTIGSL